MKNHFLIRFTVIIILTSFTAIYFYIENNQAKNMNRHVEDVSILKGNDKHPKIAMTFNISWGNERIYDILQVLHKTEIRATFFISGEWLERHPHILEIIQADNHEIAMLGYRYTNYTNNDITEMKRDVSYAYDVFKKYDLKPAYIRAPNGIFSDEMQTYLEQFQLTPVHYSLNANDLQAASPKAIIEKTMKDIENGDILLFHASDIAIHTAGALEQIIPQLKKDDMQIITLTELLNEIDMEEKPID